MSPISWTPVKTWNTGDTLPAADLNTYLRDNLVWLHDRGADLASAGTITPTTGFHKVTGTTQIDNIAAPTDGNTVWLWFTGALTIRNNGGGTGNIRTASGADKPVVAETLLAFRSDGTVWKEIGVGGTTSADSTLGSDTAAFDFQNIAGGAHLRAIIHARGSAVSTGSDLIVQVNNDGTASYDRLLARSDGTSTNYVGLEAFAATSVAEINAVPAANAPANTFGAHELVIAHYAGAANHKAGVSHWASKLGTTVSSGNLIRGYTSFFWRSTAAINRLGYSLGAGNFKAGSRASVYTF